MAHTLTRSFALVDLTVGDSTQFVRDDWISAPSTAIGIVAEVIDATSIAVYEMSANAFTPTEVLTALVSTNTSTCTASGAYAGGKLPADAALVEGTDSTVENIFRKIADISGIGGVTNPSSTQNFLGLEMFVWIGSHRQTADTYALSYEEHVRIGDAGAKGGLRIVGNTTYSTALQSGIHKYKDNDLDNFPPLYTQEGSIIDIRMVNAATDGIGVDVYSSLYFNSSTLKGDGVGSIVIFNNFGDVRFVNASYLDFTGFFGNNSGAKLYLEGFYSQELIEGGFLFLEPATYSNNVFFQNTTAAFRGPIISFAFSWEASMAGVFYYDNNGVYETGKGLLATGFSDNVIHLVNSDVDVTKYDAIFVGRGTSLKEISLKLKITDYLGNAIQGVSVNVIKYISGSESGKALFRITNVLADTTPYITATQTTITFIADHGLSAGDYFRLSSEEMKVTSVTTTKIVVVTRGVNGTGNIIHAGHGNATTQTTDHQFLAIAEIASTDSSGEIEYATGSNGKNAIVQEMASFSGGIGIQSPLAGSHVTYTSFILELYKEGYETYKAPIDLSGFSGKDLQIKLRNSPTPGRDEMGADFN